MYPSIFESDQNILRVDGFAIIGHRNGKEVAFCVTERTQLHDRDFMEAMLDQMALRLDAVDRREARLAKQSA